MVALAMFWLIFTFQRALAADSTLTQMIADYLPFIDRLSFSIGRIGYA
jgi:hypothetical protein